MKPTLIRSLDPELYRRFKAGAVLRGITLSQAFNEAMELWLSKYMGSDVEAWESHSSDYIDRVRDELDAKYSGKYVLVLGREVIGIVDNLGEAYKILGERGLRKCIIYRAGEERGEGEWLWGSIEL
ncbi:MAG TPA: hypothetical protein EYH44_00095 [Thermoprotei archaeon]|nr:hypothetical protein [Thermoprotei archaeon]